MSSTNENACLNAPSAGGNIHPWRRFWARQIDYVLFQLAVVITLVLTVPRLFEFWPEPEDIIQFAITQAILCALWVGPEAILISRFSTTPGKWMLGITIQNANGGPLGLHNAFMRSAKVWALGCACGIYPISLLAFGKAYRDLKNLRVTAWDSRTDFGYQRTRKIAIACTVGLIAATAIAVLPSAEGESATVVESEVSAAIKRVENYYNDHGLEIDSISSVQISRLGDGEVHSNSEYLKRGGSVAIVGGCDQDCSDLDFIVFDPEGKEVARDREPDARPLIVLEPQLSGEYRILTTMHACEAEWCMSGYAVLRSASAVPMVATGTGFLIDAIGAVLTADHVIENAASITVVFADGSEGEAVVERRSSTNDIALLRVRAKTPAYLPLAEPGSTSVGDQVFVVGFPLPERLGQEVKVTEGSVTALSGSSGDSAQFQMSAPIQPGSSGSPVLDQHGHVVGIATSSASDKALLEETGSVPQLVNWATKVEIAQALVGQQDGAWKASNRDEALARARQATVRVLVRGERP